MFGQVILRSMGIGGLAIEIILVAAIAAIVLIFLKANDLKPPWWVVAIFWVLVLAFVCIWAVRLLESM